MAGEDGAGDERRWADLPADLLGSVYLRSATAYDRARFAAVCPTWRAVASWHRPLPPLPLLLPSTGNGMRDRAARAYSPEDGRALRVPLPWLPWGNRLVGSHDGGWIATASVSSQLLVVNLFSGARAPLSARQSAVVCACSAQPGRRVCIKKIIFSTNPSSSSSCVLAAITDVCYIALCRISSPDTGWTTQGCGSNMSRYRDITFCNGHLYGLTHNKLFKFKITVKQDGRLVLRITHRVDMETNVFHVVDATSIPTYIFQLRGKLAIAVAISPESGRRNAKFFRVFELADDAAATPWEEVTRLDDHALFLGRACCKAVQVSTSSPRGSVETNRIYYAEQHFYNHLHRDIDLQCSTKLDLGSCTVYCCQSQALHPLEKILSRGYHYIAHNSNGCCNICMWLLPPAF